MSTTRNTESSCGISVLVMYTCGGTLYIVHKHTPLSRYNCTLDVAMQNSFPSHLLVVKLVLHNMLLLGNLYSGSQQNNGQIHTKLGHIIIIHPGLT